jgi:hypothetical protein
VTDAPGRQARLRAEYASLYPGLEPGFWVDANELAEQLLTHMDSITPESACTSVQLHVQVSPDSFANYWNAAQSIAGVQVALAARAR